ncbi:MAG: hypothetical protein Fur0043_17470 [Anaerolineales bacterium]
MPPGQFVERGIEFARLEGFTNLDFLPAFPPVGAGGIEDILAGWFRLPLLGAFLSLILEF